MSTLAVKLPDNITDRLKDLASTRNISVNKLLNDLLIRSLQEEETKQRFLAKQLLGNTKRGLQILDELDTLN